MSQVETRRETNLKNQRFCNVVILNKLAHIDTLTENGTGSITEHLYNMTYPHGGPNGLKFDMNCLSSRNKCPRVTQEPFAVFY